MLPNGLPRRLRLHLKRDFEQIIRAGSKVQSTRMTLWCQTRPNGPARFAVVVSKKLGPAVTRNRTKRVLREAFRTLQVRLKAGADIIVKPRQSEKLHSVQAAQQALTSLCGKAALLR